MTRTIEAVVEEGGTVRFLERVDVPTGLRVLVTIPDANGRSSKASSGPEDPQDGENEHSIAAQHLDWLSMKGAPPPKKHGSWRDTVGLYSEDPLMQEISLEGRRLRETE